MTRLAYPIDVIDEQWFIIDLYLRTSGLGRPPEHSKRDFINAIYYQARAGRAWPRCRTTSRRTGPFTSSLRRGAKTGLGNGSTTGYAGNCA